MCLSVSLSVCVYAVGTLAGTAFWTLYKGAADMCSFRCFVKSRGFPNGMVQKIRAKVTELLTGTAFWAPYVPEV